VGSFGRATLPARLVRAERFSGAPEPAVSDIGDSVDIDATAGQGDPGGQHPRAAPERNIVKRVMAVLVAAVLAVSLAGFEGASASPSPGTVRTVAAYTPTLSWHSCGATTTDQCADFAVPLDYANPDGAKITLAVNQNMRYDQSMVALKRLLERGDLGTPVLATIEMRAVPHWQVWLREYRRLTLLNMSIHHIDCFRYLFGNPESIFVSARKDPRTQFAHEDGICLYILEYPDGLRATAWDDTWVGPRTDRDDLNPYIKWRVEGTQGLAEGTIGWPNYPNRSPSTLTYTTNARPGVWVTPRWREVWFPDAFREPMADLMNAIASDTPPATNGADNLNTMAIVEAGYQSIRERRSVEIAEILKCGPHPRQQ